jgi:hypothetical protein
MSDCGFNLVKVTPQDACDTDMPIATLSLSGCNRSLPCRAQGRDGGVGAVGREDLTELVQHAAVLQAQCLHDG